MIYQTLTILEIIQQTKDYDLILSNDNNLISSMNTGLGKSKLGFHAVSPILLSVKMLPIYFNLIDPEISEHWDVFELLNTKSLIRYRVLSELTGIPIKDVFIQLNQLLNYWKENGSLAEWKSYFPEDYQKIAEWIENFRFPVPEFLMEKFNWDQVKLRPDNVLVIEEILFSPLEKCLLPEKYDSLNLMKSEEKCFNPFNCAFNEIMMVDELISQIKTFSEEELTDTGIIISKSDNCFLHLRARLEEISVPIQEGIPLNKTFGCSVFHEIIQKLSYNKGTLFQEWLFILKQIHTKISEENAEKEGLRLFQSITVSENLSGMEFLEKYSNKTYMQVLMELFDEDNDLRREMMIFLEECGLVTETIQSENLWDFVFLLKNTFAKTPAEKKGVIIVDPGLSLFVDRQKVFFVGMDSHWFNPGTLPKWGNAHEKNEIQRRKFQILLNQGKFQYFFTSHTSGGNERIPCELFSELTGHRIDSFQNTFFTKYHLSSLPSESKDKIKEFLQGEGMEIPLFSPSSFNQFCNCPAQYYYSRIINKPESPAQLTGNLFHKHIENSALGIPFEKDNLASEMTREIHEKFPDYYPGDLEWRIFTGLQTIEKYFLKHPITHQSEISFQLDDFPVRGRYDLLLSDSFVFDLKTSRIKKKAGKIWQNTFHSIKYPENCEGFDFQSFIYLWSLMKSSQEIICRADFLYCMEEETVYREFQENLPLNSFELRNCSLNEFLSSREVDNGFEEKIPKTLKKKWESEKEQFFQLKENLFETNMGDYLMALETAESFPLTPENTIIMDSNKALSDIFNRYIKYLRQLSCGEIVSSEFPVSVFCKEHMEVFEDFFEKKFQSLSEIIEKSLFFEHLPVSEKVCDNCNFRSDCLSKASGKY